MDSLQIKNTGLILEAPQEKDWIFGGATGAINKKVIFPNGDGWLSIQRPEQTQRNRNFDTFSCVTFACLKALSYYLKAVYNLDVNFSERFTAVMSGTIPGQGNSIRAVLESIRKDGFLLEEDCPFTEDMTATEFYSDVEQWQKDKAKANLANFMGMGPILIEWECVSNNPFDGGLINHADIQEMLKYAPVITTGYAWQSIMTDEGIVYIDAGNPNHCFLGIRKNNLKISNVKADDTYPQDYGLDKQPDSNYLKNLHNNYSLHSAYKITGTFTGRPESLFTNFKKMFSKIRAYLDDKNIDPAKRGLKVFWVDKGCKQEIILTSQAEKALFMSAFADKDIKPTSWPELSKLKDAKFI